MLTEAMWSTRLLIRPSTSDFAVGLDPATNRRHGVLVRDAVMTSVDELLGHSKTFGDGDTMSVSPLSSLAIGIEGYKLFLVEIKHEHHGLVVTDLEYWLNSRITRQSDSPSVHHFYDLRNHSELESSPDHLVQMILRPGVRFFRPLGPLRGGEASAGSDEDKTRPDQLFLSKREFRKSFPFLFERVTTGHVTFFDFPEGVRGKATEFPFKVEQVVQRPKDKTILGKRALEDEEQMIVRECWAAWLNGRIIWPEHGIQGHAKLKNVKRANAGWADLGPSLKFFILISKMSKEACLDEFARDEGWDNDKKESVAKKWDEYLTEFDFKTTIWKTIDRTGSGSKTTVKS